MKYGVLAAAEYFGQYSLIELRDSGVWTVIAKGSRQNMQQIAAALNEHDERSQPVVAAAPAPPWPGLADEDTITVQEVESWTPAERLQAREKIRASTVGPVTTYHDELGRLYSTNAAQLVTGQAFIKPRRISDSPQA